MPGAGSGGAGAPGSATAARLSMMPSPLRAATKALARTRSLPAEHAVFHSYRAQEADLAVFPPRSVPRLVRLPRLPGVREGPAPLAFGAAPSDVPSAAAAEMANMWMVGFMDARGKGDALRLRKPPPMLPGMVTGKRHFRGGFASWRRAGTVTGRDEVDAAERDFLAASGEFQRLLHKVKDAFYKERRKGLAAADAAAHRIHVNPLSAENERIRRAILGARGGGAGSSPDKLAMRSSGLDRLVLLERLEVQGAIVLQRFWRRHLRRLFWRRYLLEQRCAFHIQVRARAPPPRQLVRRQSVC